MKLQSQEVRELPSTPLFAGVEKEDWPELLGRSVRLDLKVGDSVFRQGEEADAFFVVIAGSVEVRTKMKVTNTEKSLAHLGAGAVLGETSLFVRGPHSASVRAAEPSTLLSFQTESFMDMIRTGHRGAIQVLYNIGNTLAVRLRSADEQLTGAAYAAPSGVIGNTEKSRKIIPADRGA